MKKEFIMSEEERTVKRQKIEENRMKKSKPVQGGQNNVLGSSIQQVVRIRNESGAPQIRGSRKRQLEAKSEAESSFSDSDATVSPLLDHSSESFHDCLSTGRTTLVSSVKFPGSRTLDHKRTVFIF